MTDRVTEKRGAKERKVNRRRKKSPAGAVSPAAEKEIYRSGPKRDPISSVHVYISIRSSSPSLRVKGSIYVCSSSIWTGAKRKRGGGYMRKAARLLLPFPQLNRPVEARLHARSRQIDCDRIHLFSSPSSSSSYCAIE